MKKRGEVVSLCFGITALMLIQFVSAELNLQINSQMGGKNANFYAKTDSSASNNFDLAFDAKVQDPPSNYSLLYSDIGDDNLIVDTFSSTNFPRTFNLVYSSSPALNGSLLLSWNFSDSNYNATLYRCIDGASCDVLSAGVSMKTTSSYSVTDTPPLYFQLVVSNVSTSNPAPENPASSENTGGNGGGSTQKMSLKINVLELLSVSQSGEVIIPVELENDGEVIFNDVNVKATLLRDSIVLSDLVSMDKSYFKSITSGAKEKLILTTNINKDEASFYEILINVTSSSPVYNINNKVVFNLIGKDTLGVVKTIAFTENLIEANPECYELQDLINQAQEEFDAGNIEMAIEKAKFAIEACKKNMELGSKKTIYQKVKNSSFFTYFLVFLISALIIWVGFAIYKSIRFKQWKK